MFKKFSEITPQLQALADLCVARSTIPQEMYTKHQVYRGLRDLNGKGVLTGLTEISDIRSRADSLRRRALLPRHQYPGYRRGVYVGKTLWL